MMAIEPKRHDEIIPVRRHVFRCANALRAKPRTRRERAIENRMKMVPRCRGSTL